MTEPALLPGDPATNDVVRDWAVAYWERSAVLRTLGAPLQAVCAVNAQRLKTRFIGL